ncbi:hypothetical protein [Ochrobactrum sp. BTU1]|uniref:hypothetical protein n=1 Tax=Ochrobactrum sp. BTU1 TaxID=2840456 RepID=UPI001C052848|nr:hypothetical protein KMS41_24915 [Ochrobactrum sp. BTU1]
MPEFVGSMGGHGDRCHRGRTGISILAQMVGVVFKLGFFFGVWMKSGMTDDEVDRGGETPIDIDENRKKIIRGYLEDILRSDTFRRSYRMKAFLIYIVEEALAGRSAMLKEYSIGVDVFGKPGLTEAADDSVVRTSAKRLRLLLEQYYENAGKADTIRIMIPKGGYSPLFYENQPYHLSLGRELRLAAQVSDGGRSFDPTSTGNVFCDENHEENRNIRPAANRWLIGGCLLAILGLLLVIQFWTNNDRALSIHVRYKPVQGAMTLADFKFKNGLISNLVALGKADIIETSSQPQRITRNDYFLDVEQYRVGDRNIVVSRLVEAFSNRIVWNTTMIVSQESEGIDVEATSLAHKVAAEVVRLHNRSLADAN